MTFKEHQDSLLHIIGDFTGGTRTKVKRWVNDGYAILWEQIYGPYKTDIDYIQTTAAYESTSAITVTVTNDSTTVTSDGTTDTAFTEAMVGRFIQLNGTDPWYRISSRTSATEIELEDAYLGDSDTECAFEVHTYRWALPTTVQRVTQVVAELDERTCPLALVDKTAIRKDWARPLEWDTGTPEYAWVDEKDSNGAYQLAIWPVPTSAALIQVRFEKEITALSSDSDTLDIEGADDAVQAHAMTKAMTYKGRIREVGYWRTIYETERKRLTETVPRQRGTQFRHKDPSDATSSARGVNLGPMFPRRW